MQLLNNSSVNNNQSLTKNSTNPNNNKTNSNNLNNQNGDNILFNNEWKTEQDYKREIIGLQIQNEKYRNQLYELGETVNKILDKVKLSSNNKVYPHTPNLEQQLQLTKKQLQNVNKFIQIYQKELQTINNKKKKDQLQNLSVIEQLLKSKTEELTLLKKQVRQLSHKNKGLQYKLLEYSKKNKIKSIDQQALQLKQLLNQNKNLKSKLQQLELLQQKKSKWLENNIQSAKQLQKKVQDQQSKLPRIQSRTKYNQTEQNHERHSGSLPKLQSEKKIYTKWLQSASVSKKNNQLDKQLEDLQKINKMVQEKIKNTTKQIKEIEQQISKIKQRVQQSQYEEKQKEKQSIKLNNSKGNLNKESSKSQISQEIVNNNGKAKKKHVGTMVQKRARKIRKDWVGKFDGLRFSDNRFVREQSRLYKIMFNSMGFCQFFYYSTKDPKKRINSKLPFDTVNLVNPGKQSTFTVEHPDFMKNIRLKLNITMISNLGIEGEFQVDTSLHALNPQDKASTKKLPGSNNKESKEQQTQVNYEMDIKPNQAITYIFGSYGVKTDDKKNITNVWLEGLGVEIIEDFVQELI